MAATTASRTIGGTVQVQVRPDISDAQWDRIYRESAKHAAQAAKLKVPSVLRIRDRYVFRTKPDLGTRAFHLMIDVETEFHEDVRMASRAEAAYKRRVGNAHIRALGEAAYQAVGKRTLTFQRIGKATETYFGTHSEAVANWMRAKIAEGKGSFASIYEDRGAVAIKVGDRLFANTPEQTQAAMEYSHATGLPTELFQEKWMDPDDVARTLTPDEIEDAEIAALLEAEAVPDSDDSKKQVA